MGARGVKRFLSSSTSQIFPGVGACVEFGVRVWFGWVERGFREEAETSRKEGQKRAPRTASTRARGRGRAWRPRATCRGEEDGRMEEEQEGGRLWRNTQEQEVNKREEGES
eukprot:2473898-Rhodomonas_salina.2